MSLMKTLAKVAVGVAIAKGASAMMKGSRSGGGGLGGLLGGSGTPSAGRGSAYGGANSPTGGLEQMLGGLLGGGSAGGSVGQGGLGQMLEQLGGGGGQRGGALQDLIGGLASGGAAGGLLGGLAGSLGQRPSDAEHGFGEVLNSQFDETPDEPLSPSADQEAAAALLLRAMIQAGKADGTFDEAEQARLIERLGDDVDREESEFVRRELERPVDVDALASETPRGMEAQVYAISVLGIDLDSRAEAEYLHQLAQKFGMKPETVNDIHEQLGVPSLYT